MHTHTLHLSTDTHSVSMTSAIYIRINLCPYDVRCTQDQYRILSNTVQYSASAKQFGREQSKSLKVGEEGEERKKRGKKREKELPVYSHSCPPFVFS